MHHPTFAIVGLPEPTRTPDTPENLYWVDGGEITTHPVLGESGPFLVLAGDAILPPGHIYAKDMLGYLDEENGSFFADLSEALRHACRM